MNWQFTLLALTAAGTICMAANQAPAGADPSALGISFIEGSNSTLMLRRDGKQYLVDLAARTVREAAPPRAAGDAARAAQAPASAAVAAKPNGGAIFKANCAVCHGADGKGIAAIGTPNFTDPKVQNSITDQQIIDTIKHGRKGTPMPAWEGKLSNEEIVAVAGYVRSLGGRKLSAEAAAAKPETAQARVYEPGDDVLMSLPTGRKVDRHGLYVNFTHRFALDPAFSGVARGNALAGLDGFSLSSFGFRYGATDRLAVSIFRSPTFISRPIQFMAGYRLFSETGPFPINTTVRVSMEGHNNFSRNHTGNLEIILSRSIGRRAQLYFVPTVSLGNRRLFQPASYVSSAIPNLPGYNTFSTGAGGALDVRPTIALLAEVIPTVVNGRPLGIHRPAYSFAIQKKIFRHAFTFGFTQGPGVTVSHRAGTRAAYVNDPSADKPSGLFIGFDIMRRLY